MLFLLILTRRIQRHGDLRDAVVGPGMPAQDQQRLVPLDDEVGTVEPVAQGNEYPHTGTVPAIPLFLA